jgi:phage baseplate assembly protein W
MSYDLALSEHGDFIIAGNRDLAGVSGTDLIDQRIRTRLKIPRGSWVYDNDGTFGSNLYAGISQDPAVVQERADSVVHEALSDMTEIVVVATTVEFTDNAAVLTVHYQVVDEELEETEGNVRAMQMILQEASEAGA